MKSIRAGEADSGVQLSPPTQRFRTLDAMRGVAALFVVWRHFGLNLGGYVPPFSYLAVDLFFVLSGFVLAYANDRAFARGQTRTEFLRKRLLRIAPLYLVGMALGIVAQLLLTEPTLHGGRLWVAIALNGVGFPSPFTSDGHNPFPINHVFWSIFFELWVANVAFGLFWKQLQGRALWTLIALCAAGMLLSEHLFYSVDVGMTSRNFLGGFPRVGFSFFAGVALERFHARRPSNPRLPSLLIVAALCAVFLLPLRDRPGELFELAAVFILLPALVYFGAGAFELHPKLGQVLGDASYALYTMHHPFFRILIALFGLRLWMSAPKFQVCAIALLFLLAVLAAWTDEGLRAHLKPFVLRRP